MTSLPAGTPSPEGLWVRGWRNVDEILISGKGQTCNTPHTNVVIVMTTSSLFMTTPYHTTHSCLNGCEFDYDYDIHHGHN